MRKRVLASLIVATCSVATIKAQFFGAMPVFDASVFAKAVEEVFQLEQQYRQLVLTYAQITNQYNHMLFMAKRVPVNMAARYRAALTPWKMTAAGNAYGTTGGWVGALNSGNGVIGGYQQAVLALRNYAGFGKMGSDDIERAKRNYATVELLDGANQNGIDTVGRLRANAAAVESTISNLEDDSLSLDANFNTEIAVLNKINAAAVVQLRNTQDTNKLLVAVAEQQIADSKRRRDADAAAINNQVEFAQREQAILDERRGGMTSALASFRIP